MYFTSDSRNPNRNDWNQNRNHEESPKTENAQDGQNQFVNIRRPHPTTTSLRSIIQIFGFDDGSGNDDNGIHTCCDWLKRAWGDEDSVIRRMITPLCLIAYSFAGGGIFYAIERGYWDFWACVFYSNTLMTTIGYGIIYPCTYAGKWFTILYSLIGIPMTILTVNDVGFLLAKWLGRTWRGVKGVTKHCRSEVSGSFQSTKRSVESWRHRNDVAPIDKDTIIQIDAVEREKRNKANLTPFPLAVCMCFCWFLLSSLYFAFLEGWTYFDSFYFVFVSVATIGLGDVVSSSNHNARTVWDFLFITIGIALFSMCLNVVQYELEHISANVAEQIMREYAAALREGRSLGVADDAGKDENGADRRGHIDHLEERKREEAAARATIRQLVRQKAGWLRFLVGRAFEERLLIEYHKRAKMRLASTQTEIDTREVSIMVHPEGVSKFTTTNAAYYHQEIQKEIQSLTTDLATRQREAIEKHIKRISESYGALLKEIIARRASKQRLSLTGLDITGPTSNTNASSKLGSIDENSEMSTSDVALSIGSMKNSDCDKSTQSSSNASSDKGVEVRKKRKKRRKSETVPSVLGHSELPGIENTEPPKTSDAETQALEATAASGIQPARAATEIEIPVQPADGSVARSEGQPNSMPTIESQTKADAPYEARIADQMASIKPPDQHEAKPPDIGINPLSRII